MDRRIACFTVPAFQAAVACLKDRSLRHRPLAIAPLSAPRAVLHEVSMQAAAEGLHAGMPLHEARRLCSGLHVVPPDPLLVQTAHRTLLERISRYAPVWEPIGPGSLLLDLTGTTRLFGPPSDTAARIQREVAETCGLNGIAGVGSNKLVARTATTLVQPSQLYEVRPRSEQAFMAPLSIRSLPRLHHPQFRPLLERLDDLNLQTFGDLAEVPLAPLHLAIGSWAALLARWAHGIDPSPVLPSPVQPQLEESLQLASDEIDDDRLFGYLFALLERLCRTLRRQHRVCHGLLLTLRYNDHIDMTRQEPLTRGTQWEVDLLPHLSGLLQRCFQRRVRIRRLTLGVTGLTEAAEQLSLFDEGPGSGGGSRAKAQRLTMALDHLAERYGEGTVRYGRSLQ